MIITGIKIKDIKKYDDEIKYDFTRGVQLILGPNGSGKSTIIECIGWALFDHLDTKLSNWVKWGKKKGSVTIFLEGDFSVYRDTDGTYQLFHGKDKIADGVHDVQKNIKKFFKMNDDTSKVFKDIIGVSQEFMASQFSLTPSYKKKIFDPLLGIEKYDKMWNLLKPIESFLKNEIESTNIDKAKIEGWISSYDNIFVEHDKKATELKESSEKVSLLNKEFETFDKTFKKLSEEKEKYDRINEISSDMKVVKGRLEDVEKREQYIQKIKKERESLRESANKQEQIRNKLSGMSKIEQDLNRAKGEHANLSKQYEELRDSIEYANTQYEDNFEKISKEAEDFSNFELEFREIDNERIKLESEISEIEKQVELAKEGKCPITGEDCPIDVYKDVVKKQEKATNFMENVFYKDYMDIKSKLGQVKNSRINLENLINMKKQADKDMDRVADVVNLINKVVDEIEKFQSVLSNRPLLEKKNMQFGNSLERFREIEVILKNEDSFNRENLEKQLKILQDEYENLRSEISSFDIQKYEETKEQISKLNYIISTTIKEEKQLFSELNDIQEKIKILKEKEEAIEKIKMKVSILEKKYELVQVTREKLREIPPEIAKNILVAINHTANRYHNEIVGACTLDIDENYDVVLSDHKGTRGFRNLSGGEKMTASVAIRLAFLNEITDIKFLALDEPTASVDDVRKQLLSDIIAKVQGVEQLFIISHDDVFMSQSDNIIEVEP